ncbi:MAG: hypothetical protein JNL38_13065 [Myxococcales bacterium]|nr:hypothetical protein [Myxococcales bacterium]
MNSDRALEERRSRRSTDPLVALHYQLASTRTDGELDAIVVADVSGVVVAGAGSWAACEELAAYAPFFEEDVEAGASASVSHRVSTLRGEVEVRRLCLGSSDVLVCARGGAARRASLERAVAGVTRILRAA